MTGIRLVYIPCASGAEAKKIGRVLVEERLAACANIFNGPQSVYCWQGKIEEASEALLIAKTRPELLAKLEKRVRELHSYKVPCISAVPAEALNQAFADWLIEETKTN